MPKAYTQEQIADLEATEQHAPRWPKAYSQDELRERRKREEAEHFQRGIEHEHNKFLQSVSVSKPYLDFVTLLTIHAALVGVFGVCVGQLFSGGYSDRLLIGAFFTFFLWTSLYGPLDKAIDALGCGAILSGARRLGLPYPFQPTRSASLNWLVGALVVITTNIVMVGAGFVGYEFAERTVAAIREPAKKKDVVAKSAASSKLNKQDWPIDPALP